MFETFGSFERFESFDACQTNEPERPERSTNGHQIELLVMQLGIRAKGDVAAE